MNALDSDFAVSILLLSPKSIVSVDDEVVVINPPLTTCNIVGLSTQSLHLHRLSYNTY